MQCNTPSKIRPSSETLQEWGRETEKGKNTAMNIPFMIMAVIELTRWNGE